MTKEKASALSHLSYLIELATQLKGLGEQALGNLTRRMPHVRIVLESELLEEEKTFRGLVCNPPPCRWPGKLQPSYLSLNPGTYVEDMVRREIAMWGESLPVFLVDDYRFFLKSLGHCHMSYLRSWGYDFCILPEIRLLDHEPCWSWQERAPVDLRYLQIAKRTFRPTRPEEEEVFALIEPKICAVQTCAIPLRKEDAGFNTMITESFRRKKCEYMCGIDGLWDISVYQNVLKERMQWMLRCLGVPAYHTRLENYLESVILDSYKADWDRVQRSVSQIPLFLADESVQQFVSLIIKDGHLTTQTEQRLDVCHGWGRMISKVIPRGNY